MKCFAQLEYQKFQKSKRMKTIRKPQNLITIIMLVSALVLYLMSLWVKENDLKEILKSIAWGFVGNAIIFRLIIKMKIGNKPTREELERKV